MTCSQKGCHTDGTCQKMRAFCSRLSTGGMSWARSCGGSQRKAASRSSSAPPGWAMARRKASRRAKRPQHGWSNSFAAPRAVRARPADDMSATRRSRCQPPSNCVATSSEPARSSARTSARVKWAATGVPARPPGKVSRNRPLHAHHSAGSPPHTMRSWESASATPSSVPASRAARSFSKARRKGAGSGTDVLGAGALSCSGGRSGAAGGSSPRGGASPGGRSRSLSSCCTAS